MFNYSVEALNCLFAPLRMASLNCIVIVLLGCSGCSPSPSRTLDEQSRAPQPQLKATSPRLTVTPTQGSHDVTNAPVIDGSQALRVHWPIASDSTNPVAIVEVGFSQELRWSADYPLASIHDLAWSPNGEFLAVGGMTHRGDKELFRSPTRLYSQDGTVVEELFTDAVTGSGKDGSISDLEWSSDGRILATAGGLNMSATLFYPPSKRKVELTGVAISIHAVKFSPDGKYFVLVTGDRDLYLYDAEGQRIDVVGPAGSTKNAVAWNPAGTRLACSDPLGVMIWELRASSSNENSPTENSSTENSSTENLNKENSPESVSLVPMVRVNLPLGKGQFVTTLEWNQDGSRLAVGAYGIGDVWLIDQAGMALATMRGHTESVWRTRFSSNGILATTSSDATTRLWDQDGKPLALLVSTTPEEDRLINVVAWSPNGDFLAVASPDDVIRIYNSDAVPIATLRGHAGVVKAVSWHPNGERLASADNKKVTYVWNLPLQRP